MKSAKASAVHHLIRAVLLFGLAAYILYLVKSGNLVYYIAPRMENYVKYAAIGLYAAAVYKAYAGIRSLRSAEPSCDCGHPASRSAFKNAVGYGLFALPLLLGFLLPDTALSSAAAAKKGMNLSANTAVHSGAKQTKGQSVPSAAPGASPAALSPSVQPSESSHPSPSADPSAQGNNNVGAVNDDELKRMFAPPDEFSGDLSKIGMILYRQDKIKVAPEAFMEILSSIDLFKSNFYGKPIEISGFVYRQDNFPANQIAVGRFAVSCCSADATPYGVLTEFPNAASLAKDTWVKVSGTIEKGSYEGSEIFKIHAVKIEKITAPETPYVYPSADPLAALAK